MEENPQITQIAPVEMQGKDSSVPPPKSVESVKSADWSGFAQQNFAALVLIGLFLILHFTHSENERDILNALFIALQIRR